MDGEMIHLATEVSLTCMQLSFNINFYATHIGNVI